jgi:uncharacterized protein (DUF1800 family)
MRKFMIAASLVVLASCGGGGGDSGSGGGGGGSSAPKITDGDAARLAEQATFGPTEALIADIKQRGAAGWVDAQLAMNTSSYDAVAADVGATNMCDNQPHPCWRDRMTPFKIQMDFYENAMNQPDQLRQRVAFALSQFLVVSERESRTAYGAARYQEMLRDNAFGNYRTILTEVTRSPMMGEYLDMVNSSKNGPNENYPRELMQLFALGVARLDMSGEVVKDANGQVVPAYTEDDVKGIAKALSGWAHPPRSGQAAKFWADAYFDGPMVAVETQHDKTAKTFLGRTTPADATAAADLAAVVDAVFNHPNTAPFVARHMIQNLVKANPSPAYIRRVADVFANNGAGVRGDMRAVVRQVLLDPEARGDRKTGDNDGKVKDPVLLMTSTMRMMGARSDGYVFLRRDYGLAQRPYASPSVFNFYSPDYPLAQGNGAVSPASQLLGTATAFERHNILTDWTLWGDANRWDWQRGTDVQGSTGTTMDWAPWATLAATPDALLDKLSTLAFAGGMTPEMRTEIKAAMAAITNTDVTRQNTERARAAFHLVVTSPDFTVDY